jgi:hypothetical protein
MRSRYPAIVVALTALLLVHQCMTVALADPPAPKPPASKKPPVRITISKQTTWITGPLREDGYPDYVRYLNEKLSEGVTPENNAMVPLVRAIGLTDLEDEVRNEYCKLLRIDPPPKDGDYFEPWSGYTSRTPESEQPRVPPGDKRLQKDYFLELVEEAALRPWARKEFPHVAKWLDENEKHLEAFVTASKLPRVYSPIVTFSDDDFPHRILLGGLILDVEIIRDAAQALQCRALLRATNNEFAAASHDLLAAHRLAVHLAANPQVICFFTAKQIECKTLHASIQMIAHVEPSREEIRGFRNQWKSFPAFETLTAAYDVGARLDHLDAACYIAREGWYALQDVVAAFADSSGDEPAKPHMKWPRRFANMITPLVRWDESLKTGNKWYDRLVRITRMDDLNQQSSALEELDNDLTKVAGELKQFPTQTGFYFYPRTIPTNVTTRALVGILMPPVNENIFSARHLDTYRSMFGISMSLCEYRADHDKYPDTLLELGREYLESVPVDRFSRRAFVYRKIDLGYLLYSLGENGRDDGGKGGKEAKEADDQAIRVPVHNNRS